MYQFDFNDIRALILIIICRIKTQTHINFRNRFYLAVEQNERKQKKR